MKGYSLLKGGVFYGQEKNPTEVTRTAVEPGDFALYQLPAHRRKVEESLDVISQATTHGVIGVTFSGGKDSTVVLDLVRRVVPDSPAGFFDSGAEYPWTYELAALYGVESIHPKESYLDVCRRCGYWGFENPSEPDAVADFSEIFIEEPARQFASKAGISVVALGLRKDESRHRGIYLSKMGSLHLAKYDGLWHLNPISKWNANDVWAYIAGRGLPYNKAYDRMTAVGVPRKEQRVSTLLDPAYATHGRFAVLRQVAPKLFQRYLSEFPKLLEFV